MGKTILDPSWKAHAAEYEHGPEMWWAFQRLYVCGTWSRTCLGKMGCGRGLGNGSALASEFCREPLDFIVSWSKHTWKADFGKGQSQHLCRNLVCSHFYHMLVSILSFCLHVMLAVDDSTVISLFFPLPCHSFEKKPDASDAVSQLNCTKECLLKSTSIANVKNNLNNKIR